MQKKILIVEDEAKIARYLQLELKHEGYEVDTAQDGITGLKKGLLDDTDLIILDVMLPEMSGIEVCRRIRKESEVPVIMLTAKDDVSDKVMGLDIGADDYMTKPFAIEELLARIRTALKRSGRKEKKEHNKLKAGNLTVCRDDYTVKYMDKLVQLSKTEFDMLVFLMENKGMVLSRETLINNIWGYEYIGETNIVDVYIRYLRSKIDEKYNESFIKTVRGVGYIFKHEEQ